MPPLQAPFDINEALDRMDGDRDLLREMAEILLDDVPIQLQAIKDALADDDLEQVTRAAHTLKGAVANLAARAAQQAASQLEQSARDRKTDHLAEDVRAVQREVARLLPELQRFCQNH
jgi:HPt (histidine-containing phosphotransfer) domain-containing protein